MIFEGKKIITIYSGDYYISNDPEIVIHTVLGSCVAVCLFDDIMGIGGMNHFMLPQAWGNTISGHGRFGLESMEIMLSELVKIGANLFGLKAKVFGGAKMLELAEDNGKDVASANIRFIMNYLNEKQIPIIAKDLGGTSGRKIYYNLEDHRVYMRRL